MRTVDGKDTTYAGPKVAEISGYQLQKLLFLPYILTGGQKHWAEDPRPL